jgi:hypothetical protein
MSQDLWDSFSPFSRIDSLIWSGFVAGLCIVKLQIDQEIKIDRKYLDFGLTELLIASIYLISTLNYIVNNAIRAERIGSLALALLVTFTFSRRGMNHFIETLRFGALTVTLLGLVLVITNLHPKYFESGYAFNLLGYRFMGILNHPNSYGALVGIALISSFAISTRIKLGTIVLFAGLIISENRSAIAAVLLIYILNLIYNYLESVRLFKFYSVFGAIRLATSVTISLAIFLFYIFRQRENADTLFSNRESIWRECYALLGEGRNIFLGYGGDYLSSLFGASNFSSLVAFHCHNQYLEDWLNFGFLFMFLNVSLILLGLARGFKFRDKGLLNFALFIAFLSLTEVPLRLMSPMVNNWMATFFLVALICSKRNRKAAIRQNSV